MATMSAQQRLDGAGDLMRDLSDVRESTGTLLKTDLRAAYNAADQWASDNAASFNTALPQPFRGAATATQKARLLAAVLNKRFNLGL